MPIDVLCECGRTFEVPESKAGGGVPCPDCGRAIVILRPGFSVDPADDPDVLVIGPEAPPERTSGHAIASFIFGICFFFGCLGGIPAILLGQRALNEIRSGGGRLGGRRLAKAGIVLGTIGCLLTLVALLMPATRSAREAARRAQCLNNLKQIGLALYNYHEANGCFPPAAITDKDGRPLLSWRVAILPYLESSDLYGKFHLDEPWDSPHNLTLLHSRPMTYACPSDRDLTPGMTGYQAIVGQEVAFAEDFKPLTKEDFTDGLATTILVGESASVGPWTRPDDLFDPNLGLGSPHGYHIGGFNALFADGSVRFLKRTTSPEILKALLTRNGDETVSSDQY